MKKYIILAFTALLMGFCLTMIFFEASHKAEPPVKEKTKKVEVQEKIQSSKPNPFEINCVALMDTNMVKISGTYQYGFNFYNKNVSYETNNPSPVPSASVIKLFIMEYAYHLIDNGEMTTDTYIDGVTVKNLLERMITVSDNSATNSFINHFGMEKLNAFFGENGYTHTKIERKMLDYEAQKQGKDNYTSVKDVMSFLDKLYTNKDIFPYSDMLDIMKRQQVKTKIQKKLPDGVIVANKTGELSNVENDAGIIFTPDGDVAMVFLTSSVSNTSVAREAIADSAVTLYELIKAE